MTWRYGAALVAASVLIAAPARAGTPGTVTFYPLPASSGPAEAANGPDGALWITLSSSNQIARMTTAGVVTTFNIPTAGSRPAQIATGPDGNVWFTENQADRIGRITPAGVITEFPLIPGARPDAITGGPDSNIWFIEAGPAPQRIGRITPTGVVTEFTPPGGIATDIATGPDGNVWYTGSTNNIVGRMTTAGAAQEFFAPGTPTGIVTADATSLWYTQGTGAAITRMSTNGTRVGTTPLPTSTAADAIVAGTDGNAWFSEGAFGRVGFINTSGQIQDFPVTTSNLGRLAFGSDGAVWVPDETQSRMARVDTAVSSAAPPPPPQLGKSMGAQTVSGTVLVKLPGTGKFVKLTSGTSLPIGTVVDTRRGRVQITATSGAKSYSADFYLGQFQLAQRAKRGAPADMKLVGGNFRGCPKAARPALAAKGKKKLRQLWGKGSGKFRTVGRFSSGSVRGTQWLTKDTCSGTLTVVKSGSIAVRDFVRRQTVIVRAGHRYLARARRR